MGACSFDQEVYLENINEAFETGSKEAFQEYLQCNDHFEEDYDEDEDDDWDAEDSDGPDAAYSGCLAAKHGFKQIKEFHASSLNEARALMNAIFDNDKSIFPGIVKKYHETCNDKWGLALAISFVDVTGKGFLFFGMAPE